MNDFLGDSSIDIFTFCNPWVACLKQRAGSAIIYKHKCTRP